MEPTSKTDGEKPTMSTSSTSNEVKPNLKSFVDGVVYGDHVSWMWNPSALLMLCLSYGVLRLFESQLSPEWAVPLVLWIPSVALYWIIATAFLVLDHVTEEKGKRFQRRSQVGIGKIIVVVFRNHAFTVVVGTWITWQAVNRFDKQHLPTKEDSLLWLLLSAFINSFIFEVVFFLGHYLEHVVPSFYRHLHLLHHTTKADVSFSGYYMTLLDFCFEALFPLWACQFAALTWNLSTIALLHAVMLNTAWAAVLHSGWHLPGFPDPLQHWLHHAKVAPRGNGVNYGTHFNLMDRVMGTDREE